MEIFTVDPIPLPIQISPEDYEILYRYPWMSEWSERAQRFYVRIKFRGPMIHRIIMNAKPGEFVDHKNKDTYNNRRDNLRICTKAENMQNRGIFRNNTSGHPGVSWHSRDKEWQAYISKDGQRSWLGRFKTIEEAIIARKEAAKMMHGLFTGHH